MLMWSVRQLAAKSEISDSSIRRIEAAYGVPENVSYDLLVKLREFFEARGFHFIFDDPFGPGVQWLRRDRRAERGRRSDNDPIETMGNDPSPGVIWLST